MTLVDVLRSLEGMSKRLPDELLPVRRKKKRIPRRKNKRLPWIDDLLAKIERQLRSIDFQAPTGPLDPKQYQQALQDFPYQPLLEAVQNAHTVVSAYRQGRINGININRVWPKGRRNIPHMAKIVALKREINGHLAQIHHQHKRWQKERERNIAEARPQIRALQRTINRAHPLADTLRDAYADIETNLNDPYEHSFAKAEKKFLG